jgi:TfoX-like protein
MASDKDFVAFVCEQLRGAGEISSRRMFGEAAIYLQDKVVGLVCDNQLFEAPPFPGANKWFLLADLDDPEFLADLIRATADALPVPKVKTKKPRAAKAPGGKKIPKGAARRV